MAKKIKGGEGPGDNDRVWTNVAVYGLLFVTILIIVLHFVIKKKH